MGTCFVVMGFGKKTDFASGRTLDLDKSYRNLIKPAVEACGLRCVRADEIRHAGVIDVPMYEHLLGADVVVADLSTANANAFYELGVRHVMSSNGTVLICRGVSAVPSTLGAPAHPAPVQSRPAMYPTLADGGEVITNAWSIAFI